MLVHTYSIDLFIKAHCGVCIFEFLSYSDSITHKGNRATRAPGQHISVSSNATLRDTTTYRFTDWETFDTLIAYSRWSGTLINARPWHDVRQVVKGLFIEIRSHRVSSHNALPWSAGNPIILRTKLESRLKCSVLFTKLLFRGVYGSYTKFW